MIKFPTSFLFIALFYTQIAFAELSYKVEYLGIDDAVALKTIKSLSQLNTLKKKPPDSIHALRYRAEADIPEILSVLHARGYYEAYVHIDVLEESESEARVQVKVSLGPPYCIRSFTLSLFEAQENHCVSCSALTPESLHIRLGHQIRAADVINAELDALQMLSRCGYPLAKIADRSILVDGDTKTVDIHLDIDTGPLCYFGPLTLKGASSVKELFFLERLLWKEGEVYSEELVAKTQKALLDTGLFNSLVITHTAPLLPDGQLPIQIEVSESKHRSFYGGISYQTYYGPGLTFGWEHKNVSGTGQKVSLQGDITRRSHTGLASYIIPNFRSIGQDYIWEAEAKHLNILPYLERSYSLRNRLEKRVWDSMRLSFGLEGERLFVNASVQDGNYWITEAPLFLGINGSNDLLNPTKGMNFEYRLIPVFVISPGRNGFLVQKFAVSHYVPIDKKQIFVLAQKLSGGFILSRKESDIPVPYRFFGGSEEDMRGYAYYSVSPLKRNLPEGGESALYYTAETRLRVSGSLGFVPFFDMGCVSSQSFLPLKGTWLKSLGLGVRYFSFFGPLRLDVAFPLNPRKGIDKRYKILISVGQSF